MRGAYVWCDVYCPNMKNDSRNRSEANFSVIYESPPPSFTTGHHEKTIKVAGSRSKYSADHHQNGGIPYAQRPLWPSSLYGRCSPFEMSHADENNKAKLDPSLARGKMKVIDIIVLK